MGRLKKMKQIIPYTIQFLFLAGLIYLTQGESKLVEGYVVVVKFLNTLSWGILAAMSFYWTYLLQNLIKPLRENEDLPIADKVLLLQREKSAMKKFDAIKNVIANKKNRLVSFTILTLSQILMLGYHGFYVSACIGAVLLMFLNGFCSDIKKLDGIVNDLGDESDRAKEKVESE